MPKKNTETAVVNPADLMNNEEKFLQLLGKDQQGTADADAIRDQLGNAPPEIERIEIKHQGANLLVMPDGEKIDGKDGLTCVVLASTFHNAHFPTGFEEGEPGERPDCKSCDAVTIDPGVDDAKASNCARCPLNCDAMEQKARDHAFGLDRDDRCSNRLTLLLAVPGHQMPYLLQLSVKSHKGFRKFATRVGSKTRFLLHQIATRITFEAKGKYKHSEASFEMLGNLPSELIEANDEAHPGWLAFLRRTANVTREESDEAAAKAKAEASGASKGDPASDDLPL